MVRQMRANLTEHGKMTRETSNDVIDIIDHVMLPAQR